MTNIKTFLSSFILVALFIFAIVSFGIQFQTDMGANQTILNESVSPLNKSFRDVEFNLTKGRETTNTSMVSIKQEGYETTGGEITYRSIPEAIKNFWGIVSGIFKIIGGLLISTLGIDLVVIAAIASLVGIALIFYLWKSVRTGN